MPLRKNDEPIPHHVLLKFLGRGSLGDVWLARGPGGVQKALKFMRLERSGVKELMAIQRMKLIHHPHLVQVTDVWMVDRDGQVIPDDALEQLSADLSTHGTSLSASATLTPDLPTPETLVVAMTLADKSLADRLDECVAEGKPGIPREELLPYFHEAAKGLDFLNQPHEVLGGNALQHCDVKPHNLLLVGGSVQICDFGLARLVGEQKTMNQVEGTLAFIAPEAARGKQPTPTTDQYSLAISYFQLLTGSFPFDAEASMYEIIAAHTSGSLDFAKATPEEQRVLRKAAAVKPEKRYPNCQAFVDALQSCGEKPAKRKAGASPTPIAAVALLLVLVAVAVLFWPQRRIQLPANFATAAGATQVEINALQYPDRIVRTFEDGLEVPFVLIHEPAKGQPFYIMETKVWRALFGKYATANQDELERAVFDSPTTWTDDDGTLDPMLPAFGMNVEQAYYFAKWLAGDQGHLPSVEQWDIAAGLYRPDRVGDGPYLGEPEGDEVAIGRGTPLPVGTAAKDVSLFSVRGMAGNGHEFTRTMNGNLAEVPQPDPDAMTAFIRRGQSYEADSPVQFSDLENRDAASPWVYTDSSSPTAIRVVLQGLGSSG